MTKMDTARRDLLYAARECEKLGVAQVSLRVLIHSMLLKSGL
jgi:hypothetical protein